MGGAAQPVPSGRASGLPAGRGCCWCQTRGENLMIDEGCLHASGHGRCTCMAGSRVANNSPAGRVLLLDVSHSGRTLISQRGACVREAVAAAPAWPGRASTGGSARRAPCSPWACSGIPCRPAAAARPGSRRTCSRLQQCMTKKIVRCPGAETEEAICARTNLVIFHAHAFCHNLT